MNNTLSFVLQAPHAPTTLPFPLPHAVLALGGRFNLWHRADPLGYPLAGVPAVVAASGRAAATVRRVSRSAGASTLLLYETELRFHICLYISIYIYIYRYMYIYIYRYRLIDVYVCVGVHRYVIYTHIRLAIRRGDRAATLRNGAKVLYMYVYIYM